MEDDPFVDAYDVIDDRSVSASANALQTIHDAAVQLAEDLRTGGYGSRDEWWSAIIRELRSAEPINRFVALSALANGTSHGWDTAHAASAAATAAASASANSANRSTTALAVSTTAGTAGAAAGGAAAVRTFTDQLNESQALHTGAGSAFGGTGGLAVRYSVSTLRSPAVGTRLVHTLCDIVAGDELDRNRWAAAAVMAQLVNAGSARNRNRKSASAASSDAKRQPTPDGANEADSGNSAGSGVTSAPDLIAAAYRAIRHEFGIVFNGYRSPAAIATSPAPLAVSTNPSAAGIAHESRIHMISAIAYLLDCRSARAPTEIAYFDRLFADVLSPEPVATPISLVSAPAASSASSSGGGVVPTLGLPSDHSFLQAAVLFGISDHLPVCERNRDRIRPLLPSIRALMNLTAPPPPPQATLPPPTVARPSTSNAPPPFGRTASAAIGELNTSGGSNAPVGVSPYPYLFAAVSHFVSVWFCRPPDFVLYAFPKAALLSGYALRQFEWLQSQTKLHAVKIAPPPPPTAAEKAVAELTAKMRGSIASPDGGGLMEALQLAAATEKAAAAAAAAATAAAATTATGPAAGTVSGARPPSSGAGGGSLDSKHSAPPPASRHASSAAGDGSDDDNGSAPPAASAPAVVAPPPPSPIAVALLAAITPPAANKPIDPNHSYGYASAAEFESRLKLLADGDVNKFFAVQYDLSFCLRSGGGDATPTAGGGGRRKLREPRVHFDVRQPITVLHLYNRSKDATHSFVLQISPAHAFSITPAFGTVRPQSSVSIVVRFHAHASDPAHSTVNGYIRVRSVDGFPLERISIVGKTGPLLQILSTAGAQFGMCSSSVSKTVSAAAALSAKGGAAGAVGANAAGGGFRTRRVYIKNTSATLSCSCIVQCSTEFDETDELERTRDRDKHQALMLKYDPTPQRLLMRSRQLHEQQQRELEAQEAAAKQLAERKQKRPATGDAAAHSDDDELHTPRADGLVKPASPAARSPSRFSAALTSNSSAGSTPPLFHALPRLVFIRPGETKAIRVRFYPLITGRIERAVLSIVALGDENYTLPVSGRGGVPLSIADDQIDLGRTGLDRPRRGVVDRFYLTLTNHDTSRSAPVSFKFVAPELQIDDTIIPAATTVRVPIRFTPKQNGSWRTPIMIVSPHLKPPLLATVRAHVGPVLSVHTQPLMFCPGPVAVDTFAHIVLPIRNLSNYDIEIVIHGLKHTPFYFVVDPRAATPAAILKGNAPANADAKSTTAPAASAGGGRADLLTSELHKNHTRGHKIPAFRTVYAHIFFITHQPGCYAVPFSIHLVYPFHATFGPYLLKGIAMKRERELSSSAASTAFPTHDPHVASAQHAVATAAAASASGAGGQNLTAGTVGEVYADAASLPYPQLQRFSAAGGRYAVDASVFVVVPSVGWENGKLNYALNRTTLTAYQAKAGATGGTSTSAGGVTLASSGSGNQLVAPASPTASDSSLSPTNSYAILSAPTSDHLMPGGGAGGIGGSGLVGSRKPSAASLAIPRLVSPSGLRSSSGALRLPPRVWIWNRKPIAVVLNNITNYAQEYKVLISHPFASTHATAPGAERKIPPRKLVKVNVVLANEQQQASVLPSTQPFVPPGHQRRTSGSNGSGSHQPPSEEYKIMENGSAEPAAVVHQPMGGNALSLFVDPQLPQSGYLTVIDKYNQLCTCVLLGITGHLLSVQLVDVSGGNGATTAAPVSGGDSTQLTASCDLVFLPVGIDSRATLRITLVNHCDVDAGLPVWISIGSNIVSAGPSAPPAAAPASAGPGAGTDAKAVAQPPRIRAAGSSPFTIRDIPTAPLTAWESRTITIEFESHTRGVFSEPIAIGYHNPYDPVAEKWQVWSGHLRASAGQNVLKAAPKFLDFGAVDVSAGADTTVATSAAATPIYPTLPFQLLNRSSYDIDITTLSGAPFFVRSRIPHHRPSAAAAATALVVPSNRAPPFAAMSEQQQRHMMLAATVWADTFGVLDVTYAPRIVRNTTLQHAELVPYASSSQVQRQRQHHGFIDVCFLNEYTSIDLFGHAGRMSVTSSLGAPTRISIPQLPAPAAESAIVPVPNSTRNGKPSSGSMTPSSIAAQAAAAATSIHLRHVTPGGGASVPATPLAAALSPPARSLALPTPVEEDDSTAYLELGLVETGRLVKKPFVLTNTGTLPLYISRIQTGARNSSANASTAAPISTDSGLCWCFDVQSFHEQQHRAMFRIPRAASPPPKPNSAPPVSSLAAEFGVAASPSQAAEQQHERELAIKYGLNNESDLTNSSVSAHVWSGVFRAEGVRASTADSPSADDDTTPPAAVDGDSMDWDEIDYQNDKLNKLKAAVSTGTGGAQSTETSSNLAPPKKANRPNSPQSAGGGSGAVVPSTPTASAARAAMRAAAASSAGSGSATVTASEPTLYTDSFEIRPDSDDSSSLSLDGASTDFPLIVHPGQSIPLFLWFAKRRAGIYFSELTITACHDPMYRTPAATAAVSAIETQPAATPAATPLAVRRPHPPTAPTPTTASAAASAGAPPALEVKQSTAAVPVPGSTDVRLLRPVRAFHFALRCFVSDRLVVRERTGVDFGVVALDTTKTLTLTILNRGDMALPWRLSKVGAEVSEWTHPAAANTNAAPAAPPTSLSQLPASHPSAAQPPAPVVGSLPPTPSVVGPIDERLLTSAFTFSPSKGILAAQSIQSVEVTFSPLPGMGGAAHRLIKWLLALDTANMGSIQVPLTGVGGEARLRVERDPRDPTPASVVAEEEVAAANSTSGGDEKAAVTVPVKKSLTRVDFGCITIGSTRRRTIRLVNDGELSARFDIANKSRRYQISPADGAVIRPGTSLILTVSFEPLSVRSYKNYCTIRWSSVLPKATSAGAPAGGEGLNLAAVSEKIRLDFAGSGGVPDILVKEADLDFGTVMLGHDNYQSLRVYNNGMAEGTVEIEAPPPPTAVAPAPSAVAAAAAAAAATATGATPTAASAMAAAAAAAAAVSSAATAGGAFPLSWKSREYFVPAHSFTDIQITFHPLRMAPLDTSVFVVSAAQSGGALKRRQKVRVRGYVGVPNLIVTPKDVLRNIDFGTCMTNKVHTRDFWISNVGLIDVNFEVVFMRRKPLEVVRHTVLPDGELDDKSGAERIVDDRSETPPPIPGREDYVQPRRRKAKLLDPPAYVSAFAGLSTKQQLLLASSERTAGAAGDSKDAAGDAAVEVVHSSSFPAAEEINTDLEPYTPTNLICEPMRGVLPARGSIKQKFTLTFSPTEALDQLEAGVWVKSDRFEPIFGVVRGVAGTRELKLDTSSRIIDFDVCRIGGVFARTLTVSNPGNIPYAFEVGPDLSDSVFLKAMTLNSVGTGVLTTPIERAALNASNAESGADTKSDSASSTALATTGTTNSATNGLDMAQARRTWLALLDGCGLDVNSSGLCPAYGKATITFVFTPTEERAFSLRVRIGSAGKYEAIEVRGQGATANLQLYESRNRPFAAAGASIDFGLQSVNKQYRRSVLLHNSGTLPATFLITRNVPIDFEVHPMQGEVPPSAFVPIQIVYSPHAALATSQSQSSSATSLSARNGGSAALSLAHSAPPPPTEFTLKFLGNSRQQPNLTVRGTAGVGILGVQFLNGGDERLGGLDFEIVSVNSMIEKYFALYNTGTVPMHVRVETDNDAFRLGRAAALAPFVHGSGAGDPTAIRRELHLSAKLRRWDQTKTTYIWSPAQKKDGTVSGAGDVDDDDDDRDDAAGSSGSDSETGSSASSSSMDHTRNNGMTRSNSSGHKSVMTAGGGGGASGEESGKSFDSKLISRSSSRDNKPDPKHREQAQLKEKKEKEQKAKQFRDLRRSTLRRGSTVGPNSSNDSKPIALIKGTSSSGGKPPGAIIPVSEEEEPAAPVVKSSSTALAEKEKERERVRKEKADLQAAAADVKAASALTLASAAAAAATAAPGMLGARKSSSTSIRRARYRKGSTSERKDNEDQSTDDDDAAAAFQSAEASLNVLIPPGHYLPVFVRLLVESQRVYIGTLTVLSESRFVSIPVRAEGGSVMVHAVPNEIDFGSVGCYHRYHRKLTLRNLGSVSTGARLYWIIPEHSTYDGFVRWKAGAAATTNGAAGGSNSTVLSNGTTTARATITISKDDAGSLAGTTSGKEPERFLATLNEEERKSSHTTTVGAASGAGADAGDGGEGDDASDDPQNDDDLDDEYPPQQSSSAAIAAGTGGAMEYARDSAYRDRLLKQREREQFNQYHKQKEADSKKLHQQLSAHDAERRSRRRLKGTQRGKLKLQKKSVIRLYGDSEHMAEQENINVPRIQWQRAGRLICQLIRAYKKVYPGRFEKLLLLAGAGNSGTGTATGIATGDLMHDSTYNLSSVTASGRTATAAAAANAAAVFASKRHPHAPDAKSSAGVMPMGVASSTGASVAGKRLSVAGAARAGTSNFVSEDDLQDYEDVDPDPEPDEDAEPDDGSGDDNHPITASPNPRTATGGGNVIKAGVRSGTSASGVSSRQTANAVTMAVPPSHAMYVSLYSLKSQGLVIGNHINRLVTDVDATTTPIYNPVLHELLQARALMPPAQSQSTTKDRSDRETSVALAKARAAMERVPQMRVSPSVVTLTRGHKVDITIDINLPTPGLFSAFLVVECDVSGVERYEIPVKAQAARVNFVLNDGSPLNFGRIPLGDSETKYRTVTNVGSIPINFWVTHANASGCLSVQPLDGRLEPNSSRRFSFTFTPFDEATHDSPIIFHTNCTPSQSLKFHGAGGVPRLYLDHFDRLDFGRCMIGKSDFQSLRIANIGNANLPIMLVHLEESLMFRMAKMKTGALKDEPQHQSQSQHHIITPGAAASAAATAAGSVRGDDHKFFNEPELGDDGWPVGRFILPPGDYMDLMIEFRPPNEDIFVGRVLVETTSQSFSIELIGTGREAMLIPDVKVIEFTECLVGNTYSKQFTLLNSGEVKYPVRLYLHDPQNLLKPGMTITPSDLVLRPYEKPTITITYAPVVELKTTATLVLDSMYSSSTLQVNVLAGSASLRVEPPIVDFGLIEVNATSGSTGGKSSISSSGALRTLTLTNDGTLALAYHIKPPRALDQLPFKFSRTKGSVAAGAATEIVVYATSAEIGPFEEELCIETERIGLRYFFKVRGDAQTSSIDATKFRDIQFGSCLVGEEAKRVLDIENFGGFPLEFEIKTNYPVKVSPLKGSIPGRSKQNFTVSWTPTGAYQMKATVHCYTPQRVYDFVCKGTGAYPRFVLRNASLDFGIGAIGVEYQRSFQIINRGTLNLTWSTAAAPNGNANNANGGMLVRVGAITASPETDVVSPGASGVYRVEPNTGLLRPNEETSVTVYFKPARAGVRYSAEPIVESKGRHRDFNLLGMGGRYSIDYPAQLEIGECPRGQWHEHRVVITNSGDVPASLVCSVELGATATRALSTFINPNGSITGLSIPPAPPPGSGLVSAVSAFVPVGIAIRPPKTESAAGSGVSAFLPAAALSPVRTGRDGTAAGSPTKHAIDDSDDRSANVLTVRILPATRVLAAGARTTLSIQVYVPTRAVRTPFRFGVRMKTHECGSNSHLITVSGYVSVIEVSQYALVLLSQYKPAIDRVLAIPHALDSVRVPTLVRDRQIYVERVKQKEREWKWRRTRQFVNRNGMPRSPLEVARFQEFVNARTEPFDECEESGVIVRSTLHSLVKAVEHVQHALSLAASAAPPPAAGATTLSRAEQRQVLNEQLLSSYASHQARIFNPTALVPVPAAAPAPTAAASTLRSKLTVIVPAAAATMPVPAFINPFVVDCSRQTVSQVPVSLLAFPAARVPPPPVISVVSDSKSAAAVAAVADADATQLVLTGLNLRGEYSHVQSHASYRGWAHPSSVGGGARDEVLDVICSAEPKLPHPTYADILKCVEPTAETSATASILDHLRRDPPPILQPNPPYL